MQSKIFPLVMLSFLSCSALTAQSTKRRGTVNRKPTVTAPQPQPQPAAQPVASARPARPPVGPIPLVTVNGQTFTTADLEPGLRQEVERLDDKIADARKTVLDLQINTLLLEVEASKRHIDTQRLYQLEVSSRVSAIPPAQVKKFIDDNRQQFEGIDPKVANQQVAAFLREEFESKLADDLVSRLKQSNPVVITTDINSASLSSNTVIATIGGQPLKAASLIERFKPIIYKLRVQAYEAAKQRADQLVDDTLLLEEAKRRQVGPEEIIRAEISDKIRPPTDEELAKFYSENKSRISGDLDAVRNQSVNYLQNESRQKLEKDLSTRLRKDADIRWLLTEPAQPVQNISVDDDPARGDVNASVTVVEFTDFQCPACAAMQPVLEEVLQSYGNKVRFVVRDFPLNQHENARKAAEAANAANAQGKFFEYIAVLFKNQKALDAASLKKYAGDLGLNRARFDAELDRGIYAAEVKKDVEDGEMYGIGSTPTIFVNGIQLRLLSADGLREAIERAARGPARVSSPQ